MRATVVFDYEPEATDELKLKVGDVLTNIKHIEDGWCQGVLNGKTGMFPDNFVKIEDEKAPPPKPTSTKTKKEPKRLLKVTFAYEPLNSDELELKLGEIIEVVKDEEEGWAQGSVNGRKGVFPTNFCEPYTNDASSVTADETKTTEPHHETAQAPPKKVHGVGFGNIFGEGPIKLKKATTTEEKPSSKPGPEEKPLKASLRIGGAKEKVDKAARTPSARKTKPVEKCRVTFDYTATTNDELTLALGDIVTVYKKECEDDGWWEGEITDKDGRKRRGVFPDNFVELLPAAKKELTHEKPNVKEVTETPATDAKPQVVVTTEAEQNEVKESTAPTPSVNNHSQKKAAPQAIPASLKPEAAENAASDLAAVVDSASSDDQLVHIRRVSGPKNRRRPNSTERRERAKEAAEEAAAIPPEVDSGPESPKPDPEPVSPPPIAPKKEAPRGIQVMPIPGARGADKTGEKPAWLKNLKRTSMKKELPHKAEEPVNETPDWLANIRKKPKPVPPGDKTTSPVVPSKPAPVVTSPKPVGNSPSMRSSLTSPTTHLPVRPPSPAKVVDEKTASLKRPPRSEPTTNSHEVEAETVKKHPIRPPIPSQHTAHHPAELPKKPVATKPRPPSKVKPAPPASKPHPHSSVDELKEELKNLKDQIANYQKESTKELSRLSSELEEERRHRVNLQAEVANLAKKLG